MRSDFGGQGVYGECRGVSNREPPLPRDPGPKRGMEPSDSGAVRRDLAQGGGGRTLQIDRRESGLNRFLDPIEAPVRGPRGGIRLPMDTEPDRSCAGSGPARGSCAERTVLPGVQKPSSVAREPAHAPRTTRRGRVRCRAATARAPGGRSDPRSPASCRTGADGRGHRLGRSRAPDRGRPRSAG